MTTKGICTICKDETEVTHLELYTIGSEGTWVCLSCRIALGEVAKRMMHACTMSFKAGYKQGKNDESQTC
jgi:hypothetical protein